MRARARILAVFAVALAMGATAACGGSGGGVDAGRARNATGPIKVWLSNNPEEITWGRAMVKEWNTGHPDQQVTAQEIPAGKTSEEVIGAAIVAGNAPCLVFNTSPAAVSQFEKQGGLVALDDFSGARSYIEARSGEQAEQYASPNGRYYQIPWKQNPVMIFYNKLLFKKAGLDPADPDLATYDKFLAASKRIVGSKAAPFAIAPAPTSEFFQSWFDFYPLYAAESGGRQTIENGKVTFDDAAGKDVWSFWSTMYQDHYAPTEAYSGDSFADGRAAMAVVGPWAIAVYQGKVDWGVVPVPTERGMPANKVHTFSDAKNIALYSACRNRRTAWDLVKFATGPEQDGKLLETTGQMPIRRDLATTYASYLKAHPDYRAFADQASRTVEVPNVRNSVEIWQDIRNAYSSSVIFDKASVSAGIAEAAEHAEDLAAKP